MENQTQTQSQKEVIEPEVIGPETEKKTERKTKPLIVKEDKISVLKTFPVLIQMLQSFFKKEYNTTPYMTLVALAIVFLYVFMPADLIPDFIPFVGIIDDASIFAIFIAMIQNDLNNFYNWQNNKKEDNTNQV